MWTCLCRIGNLTVPLFDHVRKYRDGWKAHLTKSTMQWDRADKIPRNSGIPLSSLRNPEAPRYIDRIIPLLEFDCSFHNWKENCQRTLKSYSKSRFCSFSLILNSGPSWYSMTFWVVRKFDCFRKWQGPLSRKAKVILTALDHGIKNRITACSFQVRKLDKESFALGFEFDFQNLCLSKGAHLRAENSMPCQNTYARENSKGIIEGCTFLLRRASPDEKREI